MNAGMWLLPPEAQARCESFTSTPQRDVAKIARCVVCSRPLKDPVSMARGMGSVCAAKTGGSDSGRLLEDQPVLNEVGTLQDVGLVCRRLADGRAAANVPHVVKHHSPTGFEWGYSGSGPAELALNVLHALLPHSVAPRGRVNYFQNIGGVAVSNDAYRFHQQFKFDFLAAMPKDGGLIPIETIQQWIAARLVETDRDAP